MSSWVALTWGTLTLQERRALMESASAPPPEGTQIDPVDANGPGEDHNLGLAVIAADLATAAPGLRPRRGSQR